MEHICFLFSQLNKENQAKDCAMHRSIAGYNPYNLFILTIDYSKNFTTRLLLTTQPMVMFVVKSIVFQFKDQVYEAINNVL